MGIRLDHTIVWCRDKQRSATFLAEILGRPAPTSSGIFLVVRLDNVSLDFGDGHGEITMQHYAFQIDEVDFDGILARVGARGLEHWADPAKSRPGEIYHHEGGRGFYFNDPNGHLLEILTRP